MFDGILFDLDGTLWDATGAFRECWNRVLRRHRDEVGRGDLTPEEVRSVMGLLRADIARRFLPALTDARREELTAEYALEIDTFLPTVGGTLYPRVEETLALLSRSARLFLVSNCMTGYLRSFFTAHGLEKYFTGALCPGLSGRTKADNIAQVVRDYGLARPVYVGDTQLDLASAREAGVPFVHAAYGFGKVEGVPAAARFCDLPAVLGRLCPP